MLWVATGGVNAPEAQSPEIQKQYQELEEILEHWLDKYTQEDKALVYLYQSAQSKLKNKYSKVKSDLDKIRNSLIWRSAKPFRQTMNYLYKGFIQKSDSICTFQLAIDLNAGLIVEVFLLVQANQCT